MWDRKAKGLLYVSPEPQPPAPQTEPVGDELAKIFEWFSQVKSGSCKCAQMQAKLNRWGVKGVRENYQLILSKLSEAAFERGLPIPRAAFVAPLELAIWKASFGKPRAESRLP